MVILNNTRFICLNQSINHGIITLIAENRKADSEHPDYLVKWESLPYSDATWEDGALIVKKYQNKIREFRDREDSKRTPSKLCRALKSRPKFAPLKEQPDFIGGDPVRQFFFCFEDNPIQIYFFQ